MSSIEKHGGKTLVIARFMPIVRTFVPVVAGLGRMPLRAYTAYNVLGAVLWIWSMLFIGYFLGRLIPGVENHITKVILVVIFLSLLPGHHLVAARTIARIGGLSAPSYTSV